MFLWPEECLESSNIVMTVERLGGVPRLLDWTGASIRASMAALAAKAGNE
jgi:hypothetical protein